MLASAYNANPEPAKIIRSIGVFAFTTLAASSLISCQKQSIKVKGHELSTILDHAQAVAIDVPGALEAVRTNFQTRGVVNLNINLEQISSSSALELVNTTTGTSLIKAPAGAFGLDSSADDEGAKAAWSLADNGYELKLTIYPLDPHFVGKFAYGANDLLLNVDDAGLKQDAKQSLTMQDFPYFFQPHSFFPSNDQQLDGFEGDMVTITGPYVSANNAFEISSSPIGTLSR